MRRSDVTLIVVVGALAVFVASQMVTRRPLPRHVLAPQPTPIADVAPAGAAQSANQANAANAVSDSTRNAGLTVSGDIAVGTTHSATAAPERDLTQIRAHIAETPGTYMTDMIADLDGRLVRWPDRRQEGLRIWVQSSSAIPNWDLQYAQLARDAFDDWGRDSELPIRFDFVLDSASSDIRVVWANRFDASFGQRVGMTRRTSDQYGWLVNAEIEVAIHDSAGRTIPPPGLAGIVRHEAGHALGMGHSRDQRTKMFPTEMRSDITSADRSTLRLLYQLPPGLAR